MAAQKNRHRSGQHIGPARRDARDARRGAQQGRGSSFIDRTAFGVFVCYLVLAFSTAITNHFTLAKLLGVHVYATFAGLRWWQRARRGDVRRLDSMLLASAGALVAWAILATVGAQHLSTSLFGTGGRYNGLFTFLAGLALFASAATERLTDSEIERRLAWIVVAVTGAAAYALLQATGLDVVVWPPGRPAATMGNPVVLGGTLAMVLPFALIFAVRTSTRGRRFASALSALLIVGALAVTLARGPWLGATLGVVVLLALSAMQGDGVARRLAGAMLVLLLVSAAAAGAYPPARAHILSRIATLRDLHSDRSAAMRIESYRAAAAMIRRHPVTGIGFENFALLYPRYRSAQSEVIAPDVIPTMVHSRPVQVAVEAGIPGLFLIAALGCGLARIVGQRWARDTDRRQRLLGAAFAAAFVAHVVEGCSGWPDVGLSTLSWVFAGLAAAWASRPVDGVPSRPVVRAAVAAAIVMIGVGGYMTRDTWMRIRADRLMVVAREGAPFRPWAATRQILQHAIAVSPDKAWALDAAAALHVRRVVEAADRAAYEQGSELARHAWLANSFDPYLRLRRVEIETAALTRELVPGVADEAWQALAAARSLDPNNATVYEWQARLELASGRTAEAAIAVRTALSLRPGWVRYIELEREITRTQAR